MVKAIILSSATHLCRGCLPGGNAQRMGFKSNRLRSSGSDVIRHFIHGAGGMVFEKRKKINRKLNFNNFFIIR